MKRLLALMAALLMITGCAGAPAEGQKAPDYIMEGFDGENTSRHWEENLFFSRMEEKTGISFEFREFTSASAWEQRKNELAEKQNLPDVLFKAELSAGEVRDLYEAGVLIDLKPYLAEYAPDALKELEKDPEILKAVSMADGAIPALPGINRLQNNDLMWINSKWLEKVKMEVPTDAASLKEVLTAFRDGDPNGNGKKDETPLAFMSMWELRFLGHAFGIIDNDYYIAEKDGKVSSALTTEENRAFLTWLHELWEERLIDHNGFTTADSMRRITDEKADIPYGVIMSYSPLTILPAKALGEYQLLMPLEYNGEQIYRDFAGDIVRGTFAITSRCAEPEKLVSWVNYLFTEEGALLAHFGQKDAEYSFLEDGTWEWNDDLTTVAEVVMPQRTIGTGATAPGLTPAEFQVLYKEKDVSHDVEQQIQLRKYSRLPYPPVTLSREDEAAIAKIHQELAPYAEKTMARFVTGDIPLDDEQWEKFCRTVEEKGLQKMIEIWQKYIQ